MPGKRLSEAFPIRTGLKQGGALSPLLFKLSSEYSVRRVQWNKEGPNLWYLTIICELNYWMYPGLDVKSMAPTVMCASALQFIWETEGLSPVTAMVIGDAALFRNRKKISEERTHSVTVISSLIFLILWVSFIHFPCFLHNRCWFSTEEFLRSVWICNESAVNVFLHRQLRETFHADPQLSSYACRMSVLFDDGCLSLTSTSNAYCCKLLAAWICVHTVNTTDRPWCH